MSRYNPILRRIITILLMLFSPVFAMAQVTGRSLPYSYSFETKNLSTLASDGWTLVNPDGSGITVELSTSSVWSGSKSIVFSSTTATGTSAILYSPKLSIIGSAKVIGFFRKMEAAHSGSFKIGYSIQDNDDPTSAVFQWVNAEDVTTDFLKQERDISSVVKYVAVKFETNGSPNSLVFDDIILTPSNNCANASDFHITHLSKNSVGFAWTDNSYGYASYQVTNQTGDVLANIERGKTSCVITVSAPENESEPSTPLEPNTTYTFNLITKCSESMYGSEPSSITFTTGNGKREDPNDQNSSLVSPVVEGYVCGGARMADVNGSSRVTVVNADHLYAVYGANDIAGEVKGQTSHYGDDGDAYKGAEVIVGTDNTEQVLINYVYGGGSGLYYYPFSGAEGPEYSGETVTKTGGSTETLYYSDNLTPVGESFNRTINQNTTLKSLNANGNIYGYFDYGALYDVNKQCNRKHIYASLDIQDGGVFPTIPKVGHTRIFVNSDNVYIDSLFGGAENAQVGNDIVSADPNNPDYSVDITINSGTIFSLFGGNNYGGFLGKDTYQHVVVNDTKKNTSSSLNLGGDMLNGVTHSKIGDVYTVFSAHDVEAHGIRYLFGGGNKVEGQNVHIEIMGGQIDTLFAGGNSADVASTTVDINVTSPLYDSYSTSSRVYDIRCLFGGNNDVPMYVVPTMNITSGGIHNLYGGGNNGAMLGKEVYADNDAVYDGGELAAPNAFRSTKVEISSGSVIVDTIYGGGQSAGTLNDTYIHLSAGTFGTVFGGTNILGNIGYQGSDGLGRYETSPSSGIYKEYAKTNLLIDGSDVIVNNAVFGGSNGFYMVPSEDGKRYSSDRIYPLTSEYDYLGPSDTKPGELVPVVWQTNLWISDSYYDTVYDVYGGGNLAPVGSIFNGAVTLGSEGNTYIRVTGSNKDDYDGEWTTINSLYGGGNYASIYGNTTIKIYGGTDGVNKYPWIYNLYGGNDKAGTVTGGPGRSGYSTLASAGESSPISWDYLPQYMTENLYNLDANHMVAPLNSSNAASYILVQGSPYIKSLYGGGNGHYDYFTWGEGGSQSFIDTDNDDVDDAFFSSSSMILPYQTNSFVDLNVTENGHDEIVSFAYGGGNYATVGDNVVTNGTTFTGGYPTIWLNAVNNTTTSRPDSEIDYLYGGNNHVNMSVVPRIYLLKGSVGEVYGGGNEGGMTGQMEMDFSILDESETYNVGTCVMMVSDEVDVRKNIFGGCNVADVSHDTYIGIKRGTVNANVFGGNNISGNVDNSHIVVDGSHEHPLTVNGEVFGSGKGNYFYENNSAGGFNVRESSGVGDVMHSGVSSRPYTNKTFISIGNSVDANATAVTMNGNIYGGGLAGGCRETKVDINAPYGIFDCMIFGGGKGDTTQIGNAVSSFNGYLQEHPGEGTSRHHVGNVHSHDSALIGKTEVHIRQMQNMNISGNKKRKAVFGGGYSGDVDGDTYVKLYSTNTASIPAVYLGGVAADVTGTATGIFNGYEDEEFVRKNANIVDTIYGGNDFTGKVYATDITINSGVYQHVFGGGNGDYVYKDRMSLAVSPNPGQQQQGFSSTQGADGRYWKYGSTVGNHDTVPYSMDVKVTYNGGIFRGNVYGGGNMGLVGNRDMVVAKMTPDNPSYDVDERDASLGRIHVVINDGDFQRHVFGGARGKGQMPDHFFGATAWANPVVPANTGKNVEGGSLGKQLVYGLKQIDMYGGKVYFSLHGGSESVDDGYPYECIGPENTQFYTKLGERKDYVGTVTDGVTQLEMNSTLRPSSIVNIIGGHVRKSLYGGGYQGNIYGSVYVNIGKEAVNDSPVWSKFGTTTVFMDGSTAKNLNSMKPDLSATLTTPVKLEASVYNCADWGEAGDVAYFNTRGVFGGETDVIIDGEGYNTSGNPLYSGSEPEMNIGVSIIGAGTSTEGGDINRLIIMRNYGSYLCPKPLKNLYSIQRADKMVFDKVYLNLFGEQDAFESYASPNYALNRLDTLALCNDNVLNIESPANFIGLHASLKGIETDHDIYHLYEIDGSSPNLVSNVPENGIAQREQNFASNDILDNQVGSGSCEGSTNECEKLDVCALVPTNRGDRGLPGKFNTIIVDEGSYVKISPFVDISDMRSGSHVSGRDGIDDNDDAVSSNDHEYGNVFGYTYLVAPLETMGYVYGAFKTNNDNQYDGGFVSPCICNNVDIYTYPEIGYTNVTDEGPYRTWKIGTTNGLRKRNATLIANKEPDNILNWHLEPNNYTISQNNHTQSNTPGYTVSEGSHYAYATAAIEMPPSKNGNFYIVETIEVDQANGGEMRLIDEGYEKISNSIFQAFTGNTGLGNSNLSMENAIASGSEEEHNLTFGLTMSSIASSEGGRVTNFSEYEDCWISNSSLVSVTTPTGDRPIRDYDCWPITSISAGRYFSTMGGYISNAVSGSGNGDGIIPRLSFTLTYDTRITSTIARDVKFRMLEYEADGTYVGPVDITVTINSVIRDFSDLEAPVLAMHNDEDINEYVRRVNIPAAFLQRDIYLEDIKWERDSKVTADDFHLQDTSTEINDNNHFSIKVSPVEMVSNTLNNHLGWYDIVDQNRVIDVYDLAKKDYERGERAGTAMTYEQSVDYTSWHIKPSSTKYTVTTGVNIDERGTVSGAGSYAGGEIAHLVATANSGYEFVNWSDGNTQADRTVYVNSDIIYYANFKVANSTPDEHSITAVISPEPSNETPAAGTVTVGSGPWYEGSKISLIAEPAEGYDFVEWNDDHSTDLQHIITMGNENVSCTASFALKSYQVNLNINSEYEVIGTVSGSGNFAHGATASISATPSDGYTFVNWSDGSSDASRGITVMSEMNLIANFISSSSTPATQTLTVGVSDEKAGSVSVPSGTWYDGSIVNISAIPSSGYRFLRWSDGIYDATRQIAIKSNSEYNNYTAIFALDADNIVEHYDGIMPSYSQVIEPVNNKWGDKTASEYYDERISSTSLHGKEGIKLGTIDGRAPATLDVTLNYNSKEIYPDHFKTIDPGPLAWVYLKMHWYNTNVDDADGNNDGVFWVKVKVRTREKGDTIYMAPAEELGREGVIVKSWDNTYNTERIEGLVTLDEYADYIRNNPNMYVRNFLDAMRIYQEGDVIDIMETIPIDGGDPLSIGNNDYGAIQIIRYSGSHYKFPSLGCANPHALVKVSSGIEGGVTTYGRLALRNIRFNGSGATRVKENSISPIGEVGDYTQISSGSGYYNKSGDRVRAIFFADAPILWCDGGGLVSFNDKVSLINNYSKAKYGTTGFVGGGALAVTNGGLVNMGNNTKIYDNLVVEDNDDDGTVDNYGGAVYVDGGQLRVGPQVEDGECNIDIQHNYYYKGIGANVLAADAPAGFVEADAHAYKIDTTSGFSSFSLSNVYLKRTPSSIVPTGDNSTEVAKILKVRGDSQNDRIQFTGEISKGSRIGVSKWFPGYIYTNSNSHPLYNTVPRDTVSIAILTNSVKTSYAENNYSNNVFFNDSNYFAEPSGDLSFNTNNDYTEYHADAAAFPAYNDQVKTFYHNYVDEKNIYFQRCASFGKGVSKQLVNYTTSEGDKSLSDYRLGDSIAFRMNPDATCVAITDTIVFHAGGGFFPYTYHWDYDSVLSGTFAAPVLYRKDIRDRQTYDPNSISNFAVGSYADKRRAAERDTLVLYALEERQNEVTSTYFFQATATDVAGCSVTQPVMVRVVKNHNNTNFMDVANFLLLGTGHNVNSPNVDSSSFHDNRTQNLGGGVTNIAATYKDSEGNNIGSDDLTYAGEKMPRYMRTYRSYTLDPHVEPSGAEAVIAVRAYPSSVEVDSLVNLENIEFCPGTMVYLRPRAKNVDENNNSLLDSADKHWEYMSWDFDPSSGRNTTFVVSDDDAKNRPTIYYSPGDYWWQVVNTYENVAEESENDNVATQYDYYTDYYGDVTIKTKKGLAWLISRVNGYNGQSARTFHFNTINIEPIEDLDMQEHKWTPIGNQANPFEGTFVGNGSIISNLIVNEEVLPLVGMFGYTDSADISDVTLQKVQMKGNSYIGALAAHADNSDIKQIRVDNGILFSEYVVGGLIGKAENTTYIDKVVVSQDQADPLVVEPGDEPATVEREPLKIKGNAIYFGGICGEKRNSDIANSTVNEINQDYLSALYSGTVLGNSEGVPSNNGKEVLRNRVMNCYSHIKSTGNAERLGGLVGRAEAIDMANCYVYGEAKATDFTGALAGYVGNNVGISNCYYVDGLTNQVVGFGTENAVTKSTSFHGQGKQVLLTERVDGYNNLLRALNGWVDRQDGDRYLHWRPAVGGENGGYPLFGTPEIIEVFDTFDIATCDSYDFDGITLTQSGTYVMHIVDSAEYLDSTVTLMLTINYGDTVEVSDTVVLGQSYEGYGFSLTAEEINAAFGDDHGVDIRTMMHIDSLLNAHGCDSLIILTLYIVNENVDINSQVSTLSTDVKIYPNPTRSMVTVEGSELLSVEVYDNISRRILTRTSDGKENIIRFDMSQQAAGSYYIRVKTAHGTVVKKLIKK